VAELERDDEKAVRILPAPQALSQVAGGTLVPSVRQPADTRAGLPPRLVEAPKPLAPSEPEARLPPTSPLFRDRAVQRYRRGEGVAEILEVGGTLSWTITFSVCGLVLVALLFACFGRVEVVSRARGVLRPLDGVVAVAARTDGLVAQVHVVAGQVVRKGDRLISVDSAPIRAQVIAARRKLEVADEQLALLDSSEDPLRGQSSKLLKGRAKLARRDMARQKADVRRLEQRLATAEGLERKGLLSEREADLRRDELSQARRVLLELERELAESHLEDNRVERDYTQLEREWLARRKEAQAELETAELLLAQTEVKAQLAGTVESLLVRPGHHVKPESPVGRIIPSELSDRVVVFIPERDRAFVKPGARARLEVDQLPVGEFGSLTGKVLRVAQAIATPAEIADVLGPATELTGPHFRVEIGVVENAKQGELAPFLRTGALVTGHIALRKQRLIALVIRPLREVLGE
jgi:hemolysin D